MNFNITLPGFEEFIITNTVEEMDSINSMWSWSEHPTSVHLVVNALIVFMIIEHRKSNTTKYLVEELLYFIENVDMFVWIKTVESVSMKTTHLWNAIKGSLWSLIRQ